MALPEFFVPSFGSTLAFLAVVAFICAVWLKAVGSAFRREPERGRAVGLAAVVLGAWMAIPAALAETGVFAALAQRGLLLVYILVANAAAVAVAMSRLGARIALAAPLSALIGAQAFRLPLELVLHSWYEQGSLPVQMTYSGENWDIATGVVSLATAAALHLELGSGRVRRRLAWVANSFGLLLLLRVMNIALRSMPGPLRTYMDDPPILLALHAPYTWIVPICVASALAGHLLTFRALADAARADVRSPDAL